MAEWLSLTSWILIGRHFIAEYSIVVAFILGFLTGFFVLGVVALLVVRNAWQRIQGTVETIRLQGVSIFNRVDSVLTNWYHVSDRLSKLDEIVKVIEQLKTLLLTDNPLPGDASPSASPFVVPVGGLNLTGGFVELTGTCAARISSKPTRKKTTKPRKK